MIENKLDFIEFERRLTMGHHNLAPAARWTLQRTDFQISINSSLDFACEKLCEWVKVKPAFLVERKGLFNKSPIIYSMIGGASNRCIIERQVFIQLLVIAILCGVEANQIATQCRRMNKSGKQKPIFELGISVHRITISTIKSISTGKHSSSPLGQLANLIVSAEFELSSQLILRPKESIDDKPLLPRGQNFWWSDQLKRLSVHSSKILTKSSMKAFAESLADSEIPDSHQLKIALSVWSSLPLSQVDQWEYGIDFDRNGRWLRYIPPATARKQRSEDSGSPASFFVPFPKVIQELINRVMKDNEQTLNDLFKNRTDAVDKNYCNLLRRLRRKNPMFTLSRLSAHSLRFCFVQWPSTSLAYICFNNNWAPSVESFYYAHSIKDVLQFLEPASCIWASADV